MKAYALTSGTYSDYILHAVFSTKERAAQFAVARMGDDWESGEYRIEETCLDPEPFPLGDGINRWRVDIDLDGNVLRCVVSNSWASEDPEKIAPERFEKPCWGEKNYQFWIIAKSREAAIKAANEKRAQHIAESNLPRTVKDAIFIHSGAAIREEFPGPFRITDLCAQKNGSPPCVLRMFRRTGGVESLIYECAFTGAFDSLPDIVGISEGHALVVTSTIGCEITISIEKEVAPCPV